FFLISQLPPAMSPKRNRVLSREELEIQQVLSPGSRSTVSAGLPPAQAVSSAPPPVTLSDDCMKGFAQMLRDSLVGALGDSGVLRRGSSDPQEGYDYSGDYSDQDYVEGDGDDDMNVELGLPTGGLSKANDALPFFGVGVNVPCEPLTKDSNNNNFDVSLVPPAVADVHVSAPPPQFGAAVDPAPPAVVEPDKDLPLPSTRAPTNWHPHPGVLAWAAATVETAEWSDENREVFIKQFSPDPVFDHIFSAVPCPPDMKTALTHVETKKVDYLFRRAETEDFLLEANKDLVCGLRPLLEVISNLRDVPEMSANRTLLAYVFQSMASSATHLSRGRRELGRRFVPLDHAGALFRSKPSHFCFFGSETLESAVTGTVAASKVNKDLIILPKKRAFQPFRTYHPGGKSAYKGRYQPFRQSGGKYQKFRSGQKGR
ncbi:unnamed protein product, partial [Meganyctiphanes norvegica]